MECYNVLINVVTQCHILKQLQYKKVVKHCNIADIYATLEFIIVNCNAFKVVMTTYTIMFKMVWNNVLKVVQAEHINMYILKQRKLLNYAFKVVVTMDLC